MKINNIFSTLKNLQLSKDKLLLILLGGVLLVIISLPVKGKNEADNTADSRDTGEAVEYEYADISDYTTELEARLSAILSQVDGAGKVAVLITFKDSGETVVKSDITENTKTDGITGDGERLGEKKREEKVVFSKKSDGSLTPYVTKTIYPEISGVLVLAQGASDAGVTVRLTEAVSAVIVIEINKIKVMNMEG